MQWVQLTTQILVSKYHSSLEDSIRSPRKQVASEEGPIPRLESRREASLEHYLVLESKAELKGHCPNQGHVGNKISSDSNRFKFIK